MKAELVAPSIASDRRSYATSLLPSWTLSERLNSTICSRQFRVVYSDLLLTASHRRNFGIMSSMAAPQTDRGYTSLLHHLHQPSAAILTQLDGLQTSIAYYLAYGQKGQPNGQTPTPLAAAVVGSSAFRIIDQTDVETISGKLETLLKAFRHAVHYKVHALLGKPDPANPSASTSSSSSQGLLSSIFSLPMESKLSAWTLDISNGLQGGPSVVRFACLGGLLVGLEDLERQKAARKAGRVTDTDGKGEAEDDVAVRRRTRGKVEEEVIVALAEVMEAYPLPLNDQYANDGGQRSGWESEFAHITPGTTGKSESTLSVASVLRLTPC